MATLLVMSDGTRRTRPSIFERLFGYIPAGLEVDPAAFPETEFPVACLECGYMLHSIAQGRCPECGTAFSRGNLLVRIYARGERPRGDRVGRLRRTLFCAVMFPSWLLIASPFLLAGADRLIGSTTFRHSVALASDYSIVVIIVAPLLVSLNLVLVILYFVSLPHFALGRRVRDAARRMRRKVRLPRRTRASKARNRSRRLQSPGLAKCSR
ncbi:MAG: hypothetical protein AB7Q17_05905 [Phycisphaerae bacterium]